MLRISATFLLWFACLAVGNGGKEENRQYESTSTEDFCLLAIFGFCFFGVNDRQHDNPPVSQICTRSSHESHEKSASTSIKVPNIVETPPPTIVLEKLCSDDLCIWIIVTLGTTLVLIAMIIGVGLCVCACMCARCNGKVVVENSRGSGGGGGNLAKSRKSLEKNQYEQQRH